MGTYKVQVATGKFLGSETFDSISITLVGSKGESSKQRLYHLAKDFIPGALDTYRVQSKQDLGAILLIRLHKEPYMLLPQDSWYCCFVRVTSPQGAVSNFPCYQWIEGHRVLQLREGTGKTVYDDNENEIQLQHRTQELKERREIYGWKVYIPEIPRCLNVDGLQDLDTNAQFSLTKFTTFGLRAVTSQFELKLKGLWYRKESWKNLEDIRRVFWFNKTPTSEYVTEHWKEDGFFGYQYLNGLHPTMIQKCTKIPANFPVTQEMVAKSLGESTTLQEELQKGNIFIVDYKILQGVSNHTINGQLQYLALPLCLFYHTPVGELLPIAIQLSQSPGPDSPIFLPSDPEWDWTLAKMWVRNADFHVHENITHLLRTHLIGEVFTMATLRQLPMCHPLFKLLIPHTRYNLQINTLARLRLITVDGLMEQASSSGYKGSAIILKRGFQNFTYDSFCLPIDIESRGMASIRNYYYRDDGLKIWAAIESYVSGIVKFYYKDDARIQNDAELQAWIMEIFTEGFQGNTASGAPSSLKTATELTQFLTMVIFTCSAQHAAVNSGQFDFGAWLPNMPPSMRKPPPKVKGTATVESILETIPQISVTCVTLVALWLLSNEEGDRRTLGNYPDEHFTEEEPKRLIAAFRDRLAEISGEISQRNKPLPLPYNYLNPPLVENSISV